MNTLTRRGLLGIGAAAGAVMLAGCENNAGPTEAGEIDRRVALTVSYMHRTIPETRRLSEQASGMLVMPLVAEAGFMIGGGYGEGALLVDGQTVDYYSATQASFGLQVGAQQYAHVLFFMTPEALDGFRNASGWAGGADVEFAVDDKGVYIGSDSNIAGRSVVAVVFAQTGARLGATVAGTKYSRIVR